MITLVSSPKQHLPKHMQHSVHTKESFTQIFVYIFGKMARNHSVITRCLCHSPFCPIDPAGPIIPCAPFCPSGPLGPEIKKIFID